MEIAYEEKDNPVLDFPSADSFVLPSSHPHPEPPPPPPPPPPLLDLTITTTTITTTSNTTMVSEIQTNA
ncbi:hypothetical protein M0802_001608 [Mischocyttarus mexicanus]|nr:hypothetical protein M0802_001608 [Mischocyttarus mexicanus]